MKKLIIVSTGIIPGDITVNSIEKANTSDVVLNYSVGEDYLKKYIRKKIININENISKIQSREEKINFLYNFMKRLFKKFSTISLITSGNPLFFNVFITEIYELLKKDRIKVDIYTGISSIDHVINIIIKKINPDLKLYSIFSSPYFLISTSKDIFGKDTIIINFHSIKYQNTFEEKKIINVLKSMKNRKLYSIKMDTLNLKEIIKKYKLPKDIKRFINDLDNETTVYLPAIKNI